MCGALAYASPVGLLAKGFMGGSDSGTTAATTTVTKPTPVSSEALALRADEKRRRSTILGGSSGPNLLS